MSNEEKKNILSQEEIDALFNTGEENNIGALDELSPEVIDVLGRSGISPWVQLQQPFMVY